MSPLPVVLILSSLLALDRPEVVRGRLELAAPVAGPSRSLEELARTEPGPRWAGYAVPMVAGGHALCGNRVVRLDDDRGLGDGDAAGASGELFLLYRVEGREVTDLRLLSPGCRVDAGSGTLVWWEPVAPGESLELLESLVVSLRGEKLRDEALHAVALHADPGADEVLGRLAASASSFDVRKRAIFWLGASRGERGFRRLASRFDEERDPALREQIVFALHLSKAGGATSKLVAIAKNDGNGEVRERALFWLAQKAGKLAATAIASAVVDDPELEVKKKAVFALSLLPAAEGVPLLLEVAETHPHPQVRKQAFFWLGQSNDSRAIALFERILLRR